MKAPIYPRANNLPVYRLSSWTDTVVLTGQVSHGETQGLIVNRVNSDMGTVSRLRPKSHTLQPTVTERRTCVNLLGGQTYTTPPFSTRDGVVVRKCVNDVWYNNIDPTPQRHIPFTALNASGLPVILRNLDLEASVGNLLLKRIKDSQVNLGVMAAEGAATVSWLVGRAQGLATIVKSIKSGNWRALTKAINATGPTDVTKIATIRNGRMYYRNRPDGPSGSTLNSMRLPKKPPQGWNSKSPAERYLEVNYAVSPLISDIAGVAILLTQLIERGAVTPTHVTAKVYDVSSKVTNGFRLRNWSQLLRGPEVSLSVEAVRTLRKSCYYVVDEPWLADLRKSGLSNPAPWFYEILPWSFVLDWGWSFGDYLNLLDATVGCRFVSGTTSRSVVTTSSSARLTYSPIPLDPVLFAHAKFYERSVDSGFPLPGVYLKSPLSAKNAANAAALLRVTFGR